MAKDSRPVGQLFSHVYSNRGAPQQDSELFRKRLAAYLSRFSVDHANRMEQFIKEETGLTTGSFWGPYFEEFVRKVPLHLLLNIITLTWRDLEVNMRSYSSRRSEAADEWHAFVSRAFREENLGYTLDERAGVHFLVDEEFERNNASLLRGLGAPRYAGVRAAVEDAHRHLDAADTKAAVRSMFESIEILVKMMGETKNLNGWFVENKLKPMVESFYSGDQTAAASAGLMFVGFARWVDALQPYRHGQGVPDPVAPPIEFAIYVLSSGASYLRWLVDIDARLQASGSRP